MNKIRVGINGFGRIGRAFFKIAQEREEIEVVAINDLGDIENLTYLLKYDTAYGRSKFESSFKKGEKNLLIVDGKEIGFFSEREPEKIPWGSFAVDVVVESTGFFNSFSASRAHVRAGAKRVVISAPAKGESSEGVSVLLGVNEEDLSNCDISSNASCTTNAGSPVIQIMLENIGIKKAMLNTIHAYTASQAIVDSINTKSPRIGRAGAQNIIPTSTGAAVATTKIIKELEGKFDGIALRVPVVSGSLVDITFVSNRETSTEEINNIIKQACQEERWKHVSYTEEPLVSSDIVGSPHASIVDLGLTRVVDGDLVKILSWYDNEWGYANTLAEHVIKAGNLI